MHKLIENDRTVDLVETREQGVIAYCGFYVPMPRVAQNNCWFCTENGVGFPTESWVGELK